MAVRSALLRADANLWQPLDFNVKAIGNALGGGDEEVNRALEQLLVGGNRHQVGGGGYSNCWSGETAISWVAGKIVSAGRGKPPSAGWQGSSSIM